MPETYQRLRRNRRRSTGARAAHRTAKDGPRHERVHRAAAPRNQGLSHRQFGPNGALLTRPPLSIPPLM